MLGYVVYKNGEDTMVGSEDSTWILQLFDEQQSA